MISPLPAYRAKETEFLPYGTPEEGRSKGYR